MNASENTPLFSKKNAWRFAEGAETLFPQKDPIAAFVSPVPVKRSAVREVWKTDGYFFKFDRRPRHDFDKEFRRGCALASCGVPVVRHIACGKTGQGACLVTAALPGSVTVEEFIRSRVPDGKFLSAVVDFLGLLERRRVVHRDLHPGNVLYVERSNSFFLVDVRDAFPAPRFCGFLFSRLPLLRFLCDLSENLSDACVCELLRRMCVSDPQAFFLAEIRRKAAFLRREWPRRREQIFSGYPKFTRREGDALFVRDSGAAELENAETLPASDDVFAMSFFLDLLRIPHRRVFRYDVKKKTMEIERAGESLPDRDRVDELVRRARCAGVLTEPGDWCTDRGGLVKLSVWKGK